MSRDESDGGKRSGFRVTVMLSDGSLLDINSSEHYLKYGIKYDAGAHFKGLVQNIRPEARRHYSTSS